MKVPTLQPHTTTKDFFILPTYRVQTVYKKVAKFHYVNIALQLSEARAFRIISISYWNCFVLE